MSKENNIQDLLHDVADAIREKKGTEELINPQNFSDEIKSIKTSSSIWTGHVDVEGLKAIGWDDDDIAYYQEHGVNWMEEDDEYHKVSDDNKALYGVLTADNIQEYKDRIVWLPKIETSGRTNFVNLFKDCSRMVSIPMLNTSKCLYCDSMFENCYSLTCVPQLDLASSVSAKSVFRYCYALLHVSDLNFPKATNVDYTLHHCRSIAYIPTMNIDSADSGRGASMFNSCQNLRTIPLFRDYGIRTDMFRYTYNLTLLKIDGLLSNLGLNDSSNISKESILYIIEHEAATEAITITLNAVAYARLATDPDIVEALSNHPLVTLASA